MSDGDGKMIVPGLSRWTENAGVRLHYLDSASLGSEGGGAPVLFVPGLSDTAAEYEWLLQAWAPRRGLVVDLRGRGASDAPPEGYRAEDHAADIAAVVAACCAPRVHLATFSRGTAYALAWALENTEAVASLVVGDYPARFIAFPPDFPRAWMAMSWRGRPMTAIMQPHVIEGIQRDAVETALWDELARLSCPITVVRGARGVLDAQGAERWLAAVPGLRVETFESSGHDLFKREGDRFAALVRDVNDRAEATA